MVAMQKMNNLLLYHEKLLQEVYSMLRSAHSIKGGAAMMGFQTLSTIAHRLEDFFKVLKAGDDRIVDPSLESLFLRSVDLLRQVAQWNRQGVTINYSWLEEEVNPILEGLYERLGDLQPEDPPNCYQKKKKKIW